MKTTIVIPSYWGRSWKEPINFDDDVYDHPTPIDEEGTLERALISFERLEDEEFDIVIIGVATSEEFQEACQEKLKAIIKKTNLKTPINLFSYLEAEISKEKLKEKGYEDLSQLVSLRGYSNVRNACLISAILTNSDVAIFFDDDEIISDPKYVSKALQFMGEEFEGKIVTAKAGYYIRPEGDTYKIPPQRDWIWAEWDGAAAMNKTFELIERKPRLKITPFAFGGNTVVHRLLFHKIAFDPNVRRGEDIDYLVNAKIFGHDFLLDNELHIKHLPPKSRNPSWQGFRENIYRFVYSREKLLAQKPKKNLRKVEVEELDPYPGVFLRDNLHDKIFKTSALLALDYLSKNNREGFERALENIAVAKYDAKPDFDPFEWYLDYNEKWQQLVSILSGDKYFQIFD
jgi:hypothetical protein